MDIDISQIDHRNVDIPEYIGFVTKKLENHIALVKNKAYKKLAFTPSNKNNFKNFFEEIVPLMFFLKTQKDNYNKIKYMAGSQKGDALLDGKTIIEITKAQNEQYYFLNQDMLNHGYAFSPKNIQKTAGNSSPTKTQPYVHRNKEHVSDVAEYIFKSIEKKQKKNYPRNSILFRTRNNKIRKRNFLNHIYCRKFHNQQFATKMAICFIKAQQAHRAGPLNCSASLRS